MLHERHVYSQKMSLLFGLAAKNLQTFLYPLASWVQIEPMVTEHMFTYYGKKLHFSYQAGVLDKAPMSFYVHGANKRNPLHYFVMGSPF